MKGYRYYSKNDPSKETIASWPLRTIEEAIDRFARLKKLPKEEFTKLFEIEVL